jgi:hypothetical protein
MICPSFGHPKQISTDDCLTAPVLAQKPGIAIIVVNALQARQVKSLPLPREQIYCFFMTVRTIAHGFTALMTA